MTPAVNLLRRMLDAARTGRISVNLRRQFEAEAAEFGPEAMAQAREEVGNEREKKRVDTCRSLA